MNPDQKKPIGEMQFDEFGRYEITEITDDQLDLVSGGEDANSNGICPNMPGCVPNPNVYCPQNPPPPPPAPPPPKPNQKCGEDGDDE